VRARARSKRGVFMRWASVTLAACCWVSMADAPRREPTSEGKSLASWVRALEDQDSDVRHLASWHLRGIGTEAVGPLVARAERDDASPTLRATIARTLGLIGADAKAAVPLLERFCESSDLELKGASALALGRIDASAAEKSMSILIDLLSHGGRIAETTAFDIGSVGPHASRAVPALVKLLNEGDQPGRLAASYALARLGPTAREAAPALRRALLDEDPGVARNAREALKNIEKLEHPSP